MSKTRKAIDSEPAHKRRGESEGDGEHGICNMCGEFCAYKVMDERKK